MQSVGRLRPVGKLVKAVAKLTIIERSVRFDMGEQE